MKRSRKNCKWFVMPFGKGICDYPNKPNKIYCDRICSKFEPKEEPFPPKYLPDGRLDFVETFKNSRMFKPKEKEEKGGGEVKYTKHIIKEGSLSHVIWWDKKGSHCTCRNCEINNKEEKK